MLLPRDMQPVPPTPEPPPKPAPKKRAPRGKSAAAKSSRSSSAPVRPSTRLPKSDVDEAPVLFGDKDLAYEIPDTNLRFHTQGTDSHWLPISSMPRELREGGWVYLQTERRLIAKCRVKCIGFRDRRWTHGKSETTFDAGPGATLELHGDDWEFVSIDLGPEGDADVRGYRYIITEADGSMRAAIPGVDLLGD